MSVVQHSKLIRANISTFAEVVKSLHDDMCIIQDISGLSNDIAKCIDCGGKVIVCGNGGFAAISQHIVAELMGKLHKKRKPFAAISLVSDSSTNTCIANDFGYEKIFARQLLGIGKSNDIFIVLSASGESKNILEATSVAKDLGIKTYAFVGIGKSGLLSELGANVISLNSDDTGVVQDVVMFLFHTICHIVEQEFNDCSHSLIWKTAVDLALEYQLNTLLLDRDGVINCLCPNGYVLSKEDVQLNDSFVTSCRVLAETYKYIFIVSNQACIGKGLVSRAKIDDINRYIVDQIVLHGGRIDGVYICPDANSDSFERKPNIGMGKQICRDYPEIDYSKSLMIGDSYSDKLFAQRLGAFYIDIQNC